MSNQTRNPRGGHAAAVIESLESRTLLSGAAVYGNALKVVGDADSANSILVADSADGSTVEVAVQTTDALGVTTVWGMCFPKSLGFTKVSVRGGNRFDSIRVDQTAGPFTMPMRIDGRGDNDEIYSGDGDDVIVGGKGSDYIEAGAGDDTVFGDVDNDALFGMDGDDVLWGGRGDDYVDGGNGNDKLGGVLGTNQLIGGAGRDTFVVRSLAANPGSEALAEEDVLKVVKTKSEK